MRIAEKIKIVLPLFLSAGIVSVVADTPDVIGTTQNNHVKVNQTRAEICKRSLPILGVAFGNNISPQQRGDLKFGLPVIYVQKDSPAEKAGVQVGDLLLTLDGQKLFSPSQFAALLRTYEPGDKVEIRFRRGKTITKSTAVLEVRNGHALTRTPAEDSPRPANFERDDVRIVVNGREILISKNTDLSRRIVLTPEGIVIRTKQFDGREPDELKDLVRRFREILRGPERFEPIPERTVLMTVSQVFANNENTVVFTRENNRREVSVRAGKDGEIFKGPCATQEEIDAIPDEIQAIIRRMTVLRPLPEAIPGIFSEENNEKADKK